MENPNRNDPIVKLNVGGTRFETTESTLSYSSYFTAMLNKFKPSEETIFIDRDPDAFKHILSLLRDPQYAFPTNIVYELEFYGIEIEETTPSPMIELPKEHANPMTSEMMQPHLVSDMTVGVGALVALDVARVFHQELSGSSIYTRNFMFQPRQQIPPYSTGLHKFGQGFIPKYGDLLKRIWIEITMDTTTGDEEIRYDLLKEFTISCGQYYQFTIWGDLIKILDIIQKPACVREFNRKQDHSGTVCIGITTGFSDVMRNADEYRNFGFPLIAIPYNLPTWNAVLNKSKFNPRSVQMVGEYVYLHDTERCKLAQKEFTFESFEWHRRYLPFDKNCKEIILRRKDIENFIGVYDTLVFACQSDSGQYLPIQSFLIAIYDHAFIDISGRMLVEMMAEMGYIPNVPTYQYDIRGSLNLTHIDDLQIKFGLSSPHSAGTLLFFAKTWKEYRCSDGQLTIV